MEHFNEVLSQDSPTDMFDFRDECELGMIDASLEDIDISETIKALRKLKNNKAAGLDEITAELLKHGKERVAQELTHLFNRLWHAEDVPEEWRKGIIIPLPKKECLSDCNNWRSITVLSVPGETFCIILLNRLKTELAKRLRESKQGFEVV